MSGEMLATMPIEIGGVGVCALAIANGSAELLELASKVSDTPTPNPWSVVEDEDVAKAEVGVRVVGHAPGPGTSLAATRM